MENESAYRKALTRMTGHGLALELIACKFRPESRMQLNIVLNAILNYAHFKSRIAFVYGTIQKPKASMLLESIDQRYFVNNRAKEPLLHQFLDGILSRPYTDDVEALIHKYQLLDKEPPKRHWFQYHCNFCEGNFMVQEYPTLNRCPYCGSTDEYEQVNNG